MLEEFCRTSIALNSMETSPVLPDISEEDLTLFEKFLQQLLSQIGEFIWSCPRVLAFFDDTMSRPNIRDAHIAHLTQKVRADDFFIILLYPNFFHIFILKNTYVSIISILFPLQNTSIFIHTSFLYYIST